jgi:hypothetical protein
VGVVARVGHASCPNERYGSAISRMSIHRTDEPPPPPDAPRRLRLYRFQWAGLALLASLPVMALAGVFGETWKVASARSSVLAVTLKYPDRFRYKQLNQLEVQVENLSERPLDTIRVTLDSAYLSRFSTVNTIPPWSQAFELLLTDVRPRETRLALVEIQAERYGMHRGTLSVIAGDTLTVALSTMIFP